MFDEQKWAELGRLRKEVALAYDQDGTVKKDVVRAIENLHREFDQESNFNNCQLESHSLVVRIAGEQIITGKMTSVDLLRVAANATELIGVVREGFGNKITFRWSAFVPGSAGLAGDVEMTEEAARTDTPEKNEERIKETEAILNKVLKASRNLASNDAPAKKIDDFVAATGLSNEKAYSAMLKLQKMPDITQTVDIKTNPTVPTDDPEASVGQTFSVNDKAVSKILATKKVLASIIEPERIRTVQGKVVELDHYRDDDLKFGVYVEDEKRAYTVHYPITEDRKVRENKGKTISVKLMRTGPKSAWHFESWA